MSDFYDDGDLFDPNKNNNNNNQQVINDDSHQQQQNNTQTLEFQEFQHDGDDYYGENNNNNGGNNNQPTSNNNNSSNVPSFSTHEQQIFMEEDKSHEETKQTDPSNASFYEAEYYQPYFNVDSKEVITRTLLSLWPFTSKFFEHVKDNPDLWGPFWISTSLIFLMTVSSNLENYFTFLIKGGVGTWYPDLEKLPWATIAIYVYVGVLPLIFWVVFKCKKIPISLIQFYCTYGYSLFIYLPISIATLFAVGKLSFLSWIFIMGGCAISTAFLVVNFIFIIKPHSNALLTLLIPIIGCSVALAFLFKLYLFYFPAVVVTPTSSPTTSPPTTAPSLAPF